MWQRGGTDLRLGWGGGPRGRHRNDFFLSIFIVHNQKSNGGSMGGPCCEWGACLPPPHSYATVALLFNYMHSFHYFSFQLVLHDWCNKGCCMCYPVCGMVHIKETLLLIGKSSPCGGSGFPLSLSEWSFTICPTPYNRK